MNGISEVDWSDMLKKLEDSNSDIQNITSFKIEATTDGEKTLIDTSNFKTIISKLTGLVYADFSLIENINSLDMDNIFSSNPDLKEANMCGVQRIGKNMFSAQRSSTDDNNILVLMDNNSNQDLLTYNYSAEGKSATTINVVNVNSNYEKINDINLYVVNLDWTTDDYKTLLKGKISNISNVISFNKDKSRIEVEYNSNNSSSGSGSSSSGGVVIGGGSSSSSSSSTTTIKLTDISNSTEKDKIEEFVKKGYIDGYKEADGTYSFKPEQQMTRAEFVKLANRVFNFTAKGTEDFTDINSSEWFYDEILIAMKAGYINGYEDKTFRPNEPISREEIATIIARIKKLVPNKDVDFVDSNDVSDWAQDAVNALYNYSIIGGYSDNTFRPQEKAQRQHVVKMLYNAEKLN
jgi:hypothetical protein